MYSYDDVLRKKLSLLKCVRCNTKYDLIPFAFSAVWRDMKIINTRTISHSTTTKTVQLPVCKKCLDEFKSWRKKRRKFKYIWSKLLGGILGYFIAMFILFAFLDSVNSYNPSSILWYVIPVLAIPETVFLAHVFVIRKKRNSMPNNLRNYVKFVDFNTQVRPEGKLNWIPIENWINKTLQERYDEN